jgi:hypothetical protein
MKPNSFIFKFTGSFLLCLCIFPLLTSYVLTLFNSTAGDWCIYIAYKNKIGFLSTLILYTIFSFLISDKWKKAETDDPLKAQLFFNIIINIIRFTLAYVILWYAAVKLIDKQMNVSYGALDTPMGKVDSFYITWYFFGRSNWQVLLISLFELIPGILLLFRRTTLLGALLMIPVTGNIIMINVFNDISYGTLRTSILLLCLSVYLLISQSDKLINIWKILSENLNFVSVSSTRTFKTGRFIKIILVICLFGYALTRIIGNNRSVTHRALYGGFEISELKINSREQNLDTTSHYYWRKLFFERSRNWNSLHDNNDSTAYTEYKWSSENDSLEIKAIYYHSNGLIDTVFFKGKYEYDEDGKLLHLSGVQGRDTILGTYKKMPLKNYNWWW